MTLFIKTKQQHTTQNKTNYESIFNVSFCIFGHNYRCGVYLDMNCYCIYRDVVWVNDQCIPRYC